MRVEVVIDGLGWGGAETLLADLAAGAPEAGLELGVTYLIDKQGSPAAERLRARGTEPVHVPVSGLLSAASHRALRRHLRSRRPDVIHTHLGYADFAGGLAARAQGVPAFSTIHVMAWDSDPRARARLALMAAVRRRCMERTVCVSAAAREAYLAAGFDRSEHVVVVHNGIEGRPRPGTGAAVRAELGVRPEETVLTMLSVLRDGKGHEAAFAAVERLRERSRVRLVVAGTGPSEARLREQAAPLGDAVVFAGHRDDVMELLDATDVLLHPSHVDAFPTALLEAMAAEVPVVATAVGGIPEIVEDGTTGLLVSAPPAPEPIVAAVERLVADPAAARAMGAAGRRAYEARFTAGAWARRLRELYEAA